MLLVVLGEALSLSLSISTTAATARGGSIQYSWSRLLVYRSIIPEASFGGGSRS